VERDVDEVDAKSEDEEAKYFDEKFGSRQRRFVRISFGRICSVTVAAVVVVVVVVMLICCCG
jgi:hypothetical protein